MWAHQRDSAVELVVATALDLGQQGLGERSPVELPVQPLVQAVGSPARRRACSRSRRPRGTLPAQRWRRPFRRTAAAPRPAAGVRTGSPRRPWPGWRPRRRAWTARPPATTAPAGGAGGLEQRVALPQHAVVVGADTGQPGGAQHQQVVEELAPIRRVALDQGQVVGREDDRAHQADQLAGAGQRRLVDPGPVGAAGVELDLEYGGPPLTHHGRPDHTLVGAGQDQRARRWRPGATAVWTGSRSPRPGWSFPGRWGR